MLPMPRSPGGQPTSTAKQEMKRLLVWLIVAVTVLDGTVIGVYYALDLKNRTEKAQTTFVAIWVVLTLIVVTTMMKRIRQARRRS